MQPDSKSRSKLVIWAISGMIVILIAHPVLPRSAALMQEPTEAALYGSANDSGNSVLAAFSGRSVGHIAVYGDDADDDKGDKKSKKHHGDDEDERDERKGKGHDGDNDDDHKGKDKNHNDDGDDPPDNPGHDAPSALSQTVTAKEDTPVEIVLGGRIDNNRDTISFTIVDEPQHGELEELDERHGTFTYYPSQAFFGTDSFTFKVGDGLLQSPPATVTISVEAVNDPPVAIGGQVSIREDRSLSLLLSASDVDNDDLEYEITSGPEHGSLGGTAPTLVYEPDRNFRGSDSIAFRANDGSADSNMATVAITVKSEKRNDSRDEVRWWENVPSNTVTDNEETSAAIDPIDLNAAESVDALDNVQDGPISQANLVDSPGHMQDSIFEKTETTIRDVSFTQRDVHAPKLIFPAATLEAVASSVAGVTVPYVVKAVDDTDGEIEASCSPDSGYKFLVGKFNVVCWATDAAGNTALGSFVVVVSQASSAGSVSSPLLLPLGITVVVGAGAYVGFRALKRASKV